MKKFIKIFIIVISFFIAIIVFYFLFLYFANKNVKDIAPIDDSRMNVNLSLIEDKDNSYLDLKKINDTLSKEDYDYKMLERYLNLDNYNKKEVEEIIKKHEELISILDKAIAKKNFQNPFIIKGFKKNDPSGVSESISYLRDITSLYIIKNNYLFKNSKEEEAFKNLDNLLTLYNEIFNSEPQSTVQFSSSKICFSEVLDAQRQYLQQTKLSNDLLKKHLILLSTLDISNGLLNVYKGEYFFEKKRLDEIASSDNYKDSYYFSRNDCQKSSYDYYMRRFNYINIPYSEFIKLSDQLRNNDPIFIMFIKGFFTKNSICKTLSNLSETRYFDLSLKQKYSIDYYLAVNKLVFASRLYYNDNKKLPNKLEDLVPKYIEDLPVDTFSGDSFGYDAQGKTIYSTANIEAIDNKFSVSF